MDRRGWGPAVRSMAGARRRGRRARRHPPHRWERHRAPAPKCARARAVPLGIWPAPRWSSHHRAPRKAKRRAGRQQPRRGLRPGAAARAARRRATAPARPPRGRKVTRAEGGRRRRRAAATPARRFAAQTEPERGTPLAARRPLRRMRRMRRPRRHRRRHRRPCRRRQAPRGHPVSLRRRHQSPLVHPRPRPRDPSVCRFREEGRGQRWGGKDWLGPDRGPSDERVVDGRGAIPVRSAISGRCSILDDDAGTAACLATAGLGGPGAAGLSCALGMHATPTERAEEGPYRLVARSDGQANCDSGARGRQGRGRLSQGPRHGVLYPTAEHAAGHDEALHTQHAPAVTPSTRRAHRGTDQPVVTVPVPDGRA
eukprot:scaffold6285_cov121-Isochrysis_galbana.AAC.24